MGLATWILACGRTAPPTPPIEREIAAGQDRAFVLRLPARRYLSLAYRQIGLEIEGDLAGPDGRRLAEAGRAERRTLKRLAVVTREAGRYRLTLRARDAAGVHGRFRLELDELHPAEREDGLRAEARRAFSEGLRVWDRGDALGGMKRLEKARDLWRRAGDRRGEVDAENEIGNLLTYSDVEQAYRVLDGALAAARRAGYETGEAKALGYLDVADLFFGRQGATVPQRRDAILAQSRRGLALWRQAGDVAEQGEVLSNLGFLNGKASFSSAPARAARWYQAALGLRRAAGDVEGEANTLNGLGIARQWENDYSRAEELFLAARQLSRRLADRRVEAQIVANLASVYQVLGEHQKALDLYSDPLLTDEKVAPLTSANRLANVGALYTELGQLDQALDAYRRLLASKVSGTEESLRLHAMITMGQLFLQRGEVPTALERLSQALEESRRAKSQDLEALALESLGGYYLQSRQPPSALPYLERARELRRAAPDRSAEAEVVMRMGSAHRQLGETEPADRELGEALRLARAGGRQSTLVACLQARGAFDLQRGDAESARREAEEAIAAIEAARGKVASDDLRISFLSRQRSLYDLDVDALVDLDGRHPGQGFGGAALTASERGHARGLLDLIAEGQLGLRTGASPALRQRQAELARRLAAAGDRLARARAARPADAAAIGRLETELRAVQQREQELAAEIRQRAEFVHYPAPLGAAEIQRLLDERTALLEYWLGERHSYLFVVTRAGLTVHRLPRTAAEIERRVAELRRAIESPGGARLASYRREAARLYRDLVPPGAAGERDLLIVPDGVLHLLPFEVLLTAEAGGAVPLARLPYLLAAHTIAYVPSASVLQSLRSAVGRPQEGRRLSLLAYAYPGGADAAAGPPPVSAPDGPGAPARGAPGLALLTRVRSEVAAIASLYPAAARVLYVDDRASRRNVVANPLVEAARRIHFASHGLIDEEHPELSSLVLAPDGPGDDGKLRMADILNLKLDADLVVLSACETGLGRQVTGEGLVGLSRAFFYAGARSLAVSLWLVADSSTPHLMRELYSRLERGEDEAEALRQAKLAMIAGGRFAHPFYWAPFVLVGDAR